ncbi:hypothetical protein [Halorubellus sp. PRR65]|uniref:hypothetical protein n=1 Tax=Halorubellus sp. PRR65 TaxID=3098148 RepID=UPI002B259297|nr:hypothetical protein [Halorubellus sp. PRR65]
MSALHRAAAVAFAVLAVAAVLAPLGVVSVAASTPPDPVCPVCARHVEYASEDAGVELDVVESTVTMRVRDDESARFSARVRVTNDTAAALRGNESAVDAVVAQSFEYGYVGDDRGAREVTASFADDRLVVEWTIPDAARDGPGGTTIVTLFGESRYGVRLDADRLVLYGDDDGRVVNAPRSGVVEDLAATGNGSLDGERVVWNGSADYDAASHLQTGTYVAFAPREGVVASAAGELGVALAVGPSMVSDAVVAGGPSALVLAVTLAGCLFALGGSPNPGRAARWLAAVGGVVTVGGLAYALLAGYGPLADRNLELLALPAGIAAFGVLTARAPAVANLREAALRVAGTVGVGGAVAVALSPAFLTVVVATFTVTVGGFYLVGVYDQRVGWPVALVTAVVLATPVLGVLPTTPVGGFGPRFVAFIVTPVALVAAVVGVAAYRIGAGKPVTGERVVERAQTA